MPFDKDGKSLIYGLNCLSFSLFVFVGQQSDELLCLLSLEHLPHKKGKKFYRLNSLNED